MTDLIVVCKKNNIDITNTSNNVPGWLGKPEGMVQVLFKGFFINRELVTNPRSMRYTKMGTKDDIDVDSGKVREESENTA